jgi:phosphate-selective porin OprO and OprP
MRPWRTLSALVFVPVLAVAGEDGSTSNGASAEKDVQQPTPVKVSWALGGTSFDGEKVGLTLANRIQFRWLDEMPDDKTQLPGTEHPGDSRGSFKIRRAKTNISGWLWRKELTIDFQLSYVGGDPGATTSSVLEDAEIAYDVSKQGTFVVHGGQFKVPFGRQEMTSSEKQQFNERSILSGEFTRGRDQGVMVSGRVAGKRLDYAFGVFNGNQRNRPNNDNGRYQYDARVVFQPWGDVKYSESDFETTDKPLLAIAGQFENNNQWGATNTTDFNTTIWGGDVVFKYRGLSAFGEYFWRERKPEVGVSFKSPGYNMQAGYLFLERKLEIALRYAWWDPSDAIANNHRSEIDAIATYFFSQHHLKIAADFRQLKDEARKATDKELRVQTQIVF